jgi:hypothetical protein
VLQLILIVLFASLLSNFLYSVKERIDYKYFYFDLIRDLNKRGNEKLFSFSVGQHTAKNSGVKDSILSKGVSRIENLTRFFRLHPCSGIFNNFSNSHCFICYRLPDCPCKFDNFYLSYYIPMAPPQESKPPID